MPEKTERAAGPWQVAWERFRKNRLAMTGAALFLLVALLCVAVPMLSPYAVNDFALADKELPPSAAHWFGTDSQGRDVFTRLFMGGRVSIVVGLLAAVVTVVIGSAVGATAGFYGGRVDNLLMRFSEIVYSLPFIPIVITLSFALMWKVEAKHKMYIVMVIIGALSWPGLARLVRGQILSLREQEFMIATKALGLSDFSKIFRHLLPNTLAYIIVNATLQMAGAIITEASLSYLGLGVAPPTPTWGNMIQVARDANIFENMPWMWIPPGVLMVLTVVSINLLGEGLRDAFDPKEIR